MFHRCVVLVVLVTLLVLPGASPAAAQDGLDSNAPTLVATGSNKASFFFVYLNKRQWLTVGCSTHLDATHTPVRLRWRDISALDSAPATWTCNEINNLLAGTAAPAYELVTNSINNSAGWIISPDTRQWLASACRAELEAAGYSFSIAPFQSFGARTRSNPGLDCNAIPANLDDEPQLPYPERCTEVTVIPQTECEALVAFYSATGGPNWTEQGDWLTGNDPCAWLGVDRCVDGKVQDLSMAGNNLVGQLPPEIGAFTGLATLTVVNNPDLTGPIPTSISGASRLGLLVLDKNGLSGSLPAELGALQIDEMQISNNNFTGQLPPELKSLQVIYAPGNNFDGQIPLSYADPDSQIVQINLTDSCVDDTHPTIAAWLMATLIGYAPGTNCA